MQKEDFIYFLDSRVKLVKSDGFVLYGYVKKVNDDCIIFETSQATSIISFDRIKEITNNHRGSD